MFDTLIKGDMWGPITRMKNFQSMRAHLNLPGVWLFAVKPDHVFLLETDGKGFFKLFQSYNSLYSVYYWLGKQDHQLCGNYTKIHIHISQSVLRTIQQSCNLFKFSDSALLGKILYTLLSKTEGVHLRYL